MSQLPNPIGDHKLRQYLTAPYVLPILSNPFVPFSAPTARTKSALETATSAINITPSPNGRYDIEQIKGDTAWLSRETNIDEVAALRIAVLEWQSRPCSRLLQSNCLEQISSRQPINGSQIAAASFNGSRSSIHPGSVLVGNKGSEASSDAEARRIRLLEVYLSERRYIIKTCEHVVFATLFKALADSEKKALASPLTWIENLGNNILYAWNGQEKLQAPDNDVFVTSVQSLQARILNL